MDSERIKDRAAMILAGMLANPDCVGQEGWTRDGAAADAVHSALAIEKAADEILAAMVPVSDADAARLNRYAHLNQQ